ncbi:MAG: hypothetical protein N4A70_07125 [Pelagimonas sp.]|jgi:hypothetical protein|nr:hypothetical protein [Pelagimonas sp.]
MSEILPEIAAVWDAYPEDARSTAQQLRGLIYEEARQQDVGPILESVKWGQASFVPKARRTGTAIRLHWSEKAPEQFHLLVHCQTQLVETWREALPHLTYEGNRALQLPLARALPMNDLRRCVAMALTYHRSRT